MSVAYWCVFVAAVIPYVLVALTTIPAHGQASRWDKSYDNRAPREFTERLAGWRKRAHWAQANSFEAFAPFAAAVIIAQTERGTSSTIDSLALMFVVLRVSYSTCYVANWPTPRSVVWTLSMACVVALFAFAARLY